MSDELKLLLSEGLDLCVRARKLDEDVEKALIAGRSEEYGFRCGTPALWVQEQYSKDLADWETRARNCLTRLQFTG